MHTSENDCEKSLLSFFDRPSVHILIFVKAVLWDVMSVWWNMNDKRSL